MCFLPSCICLQVCQRLFVPRNYVTGRAFWLDKRTEILRIKQLEDHVMDSATKNSRDKKNKESRVAAAAETGILPSSLNSLLLSCDSEYATVAVASALPPPKEVYSTTDNVNTESDSLDVSYFLRTHSLSCFCSFSSPAPQPVISCTVCILSHELIMNTHDIVHKRAAGV